VPPVLDGLAARTGELVRLTLATDHGLTWFAFAQGAPPGLVYQPGMDGPVVLHATANGKAFLATFSNEAALGLARRGGFGQLRPTERTLDAEAALLAELARVRRRGYAVADQEAERGVVAVAVAVRAGDGSVRGTMSVAGPHLRIGGDRIPALAAALKEAATSLASVWPDIATTAKASNP
jgi:DNA-binding IclR family transcriptional regulator